VAKTNVELPFAEGNPFLPVRPVLLGELVLEAQELGSRFPEVYEAIAADQDRAGLAKRQLRCDLKAQHERQFPALPGLRTIGDNVNLLTG
jgi:hypothetical protein